METPTIEVRGPARTCVLSRFTYRHSTITLADCSPHATWRPLLLLLLLPMTHGSRTTLTDPLGRLGAPAAALRQPPQRAEPARHWRPSLYFSQARQNIWPSSTRPKGSAQQRSRRTRPQKAPGKRQPQTQCREAGAATVIARAVGRIRRQYVARGAEWALSRPVMRVVAQNLN